MRVVDCNTCTYITYTFMYACVYMYACMCVYVCMYVCIFVHMYYVRISPPYVVCVCVCVCVCACVCVSHTHNALKGKTDRILMFVLGRPDDLFLGKKRFPDSGKCSRSADLMIFSFLVSGNRQNQGTWGSFCALRCFLFLLLPLFSSLSYLTIIIIVVCILTHEADPAR